MLPYRFVQTGFFINLKCLLREDNLIQLRQKKLFMSLAVVDLFGRQRLCRQSCGQRRLRGGEHGFYLGLLLREFHRPLRPL